MIGFTGERIIPEVAECGPNTKTFIEHKARYDFALRFVNSSMDVLDIACGVGYGSRILASAARNVVGCDIHDETIEYAEAQYSSSNIHYYQGDATQLRFPTSSFDVLVSFETIEHIPAYQKVLSEFYRVLKVGGLIVISSPNLNTSNHDNQFHFKEFTKGELEQTLSERFTNLRFYCQLSSTEDLVFRALKKTKFMFGRYRQKKGEVIEYDEELDAKVQNIIAIGEKR